MTKAQFLREANANCLHAPKDAAAVRQELKVASTPALKAKVYTEKVLPRFNRQLDELAKLEPPEADRGRVNRILELARRESRDFANVLESDPVAALSLRSQLFTKSSAAATAYGLTICVY